MAKITREPQKIFGGSLTASENIAVFGSTKAGTPTYSLDPSVIQSTAFLGGWAESLVNNKVPTVQELNGVCYVMTYQLAYLMQTGVPEYDAAQVYYIGSMANDGAGNIYACLANDTTGVVTTDATKWKLKTMPNVALSVEATTSVATWRTRTSTADQPWTSVCWSPELMLFVSVAGGIASQIAYSSDGIKWNIGSNPSGTAAWSSVCWSPKLGLFCAVCPTGFSVNLVATSTNGNNWNIQNAASTNQWRSVCWSEELGIFCAVASTGTGTRVMTSPDGTTWTTRTSAADNEWWSICWSPELSLFCAVAPTGTGNRVMTSPNGTTWTARTSADNNWNTVCWSAELGLFCAVATTGTGNRVMTSPDGINWTTRTSAADNQWRSVCWAAEPGLFIAVSDNGTGNRVMSSFDGITWTTRTSAADTSWFGVCWSPKLGIFAAVSQSGTGNRVMTSTRFDTDRALLKSLRYPIA